MAVKRAFTLIEIIMVIVIAGILALGTFKALNALYIRSVKAQAVTELSLDSQVVLDQLSMLLYSRVPASVIGYDTADATFQPLGELAVPKPVLEWLGVAEESLVRRDYSGFIDMNASDTLSNTLISPNSNGLKVNATEALKFSLSSDMFANDSIRLVFAGTFDTGISGHLDFPNTFGWHGGGAGEIFAIGMDADGNITLQGSPSFVYEKYYLVDTAYSVARGGEINKNAQCIRDLGLNLDNDTLLLFYDYRPWRAETFCADPNGNGQSGRVTVLGRNVTGFRAELVNYTIRLSIDMVRPIRGSTPVHISKQKVVF